MLPQIYTLASGARNIPPHNKDATAAPAAYPLDGIVTPSEQVKPPSPYSAERAQRQGLSGSERAEREKRGAWWESERDSSETGLSGSERAKREKRGAWGGAPHACCVARRAASSGATLAAAASLCDVRGMQRDAKVANRDGRSGWDPSHLGVYDPSHRGAGVAPLGMGSLTHLQQGRAPPGLGTTATGVSTPTTGDENSHRGAQFSRGLRILPRHLCWSWSSRLGEEKCREAAPLTD